MAFTTPLTVNGRSYLAAYVRIGQIQTLRGNTLIELEAWESITERQADLPPLDWKERSKRFNELQDVESTNPVDYGYQLLEQSIEFPDATWNV